MAVKEENIALNFLKFLFAFLIVLFHSRMMLTDLDKAIVVNGGIAVEFFFIVSGCLMCQSAFKNEDNTLTLYDDTYNFIKRKIFRLVPNYFIAWIIAVAVYYVNKRSFVFNNLIVNVVKSIPELLMIKNTGIRFASFNGPTWYISAMLLNMLILYPLVRYYRKNFFLFAVPLFLYVGGYFFQTYGSISDLENWNGYILLGTLRGTFGILAGCICYSVANKIRICNKERINILSISCLEWGAILEP